MQILVGPISENDQYSHQVTFNKWILRRAGTRHGSKTKMAPISLRDPKFEDLAEEFVTIVTGFKVYKAPCCLESNYFSKNL